MEVGDTVKLKSGGLLMTVAAVPGDTWFTWLADGKIQVVKVSAGNVGVVWFDGGELRRDFLPINSLVKISSGNELGQTQKNPLDRDHS